MSAPQKATGDRVPLGEPGGWVRPGGDGQETKPPPPNARTDVPPANRFEWHSMEELVEGIARDSQLLGRCLGKELRARSVKAAERWGENCDGYRASRDAQMREVVRRFAALGDSDGASVEVTR